MTNDELFVAVDRAIAKTNAVVGLQFCRPSLFALRAVVEWTNNLQDTESWQDDAEYNAGYNNAIYEVIEIIKKELN